MTEEPVGPTSEPAQQDEGVLVTRDYSKPDFELQFLAHLANKSGAELPITLTVRGLVITGDLVSGRVYFDALAQALETSDSVEDGAERAAAAVIRLLRQMGETFPPPGTDETERLSTEPAFIHLRQASVVTPGGRVELNNWRGRLADVSGWTLGRFD